MRPLFESFNGMVSTTSLESLSQTSLAWLDQYCSLPALRPSESLTSFSFSVKMVLGEKGRDWGLNKIRKCFNFNPAWSYSNAEPGHRTQDLLPEAYVKSSSNS
ncbi:Carbohydrate-responsive element-binding protein, partial [Ophiophagus hannah]